MVVNEKQFNKEKLEQIAKEMCVAARTAPKGKGLDLLDIVIVKDGDIAKLSKEMLKIGKREDHPTFIRDGENILKAAVIVIVGTKKQVLGLKYCGLCGARNCAEAEKKGVICAFNSGDLGIAVGSAASIAMDHRVDNRIMYTIGKAAIELGFLDKDIIIAYGIPLSATGKNPFFDRK